MDVVLALLGWMILFGIAVFISSAIHFSGLALIIIKTLFLLLVSGLAGIALLIVAFVVALAISFDKS